MPASTLPRLLRQSPDALCQIVEGQAVLLNLATERYHSLDEIGTRVWSLLATSPDTEALVAQMLEEFEVDDATLRTDLSALFAALSDAGLVLAE